MNRFSPSYLPMNTVFPGCPDSRQSPENQHPSSWSCPLGKFFTLDWLTGPRLLPRLSLLRDSLCPRQGVSFPMETPHKQERVLQVGRERVSMLGRLLFEDQLHPQNSSLPPPPQPYLRFPGGQEPKLLESVRYAEKLEF